MKLSRKEKIVNQVVLALFALFALVPLLGVVLSSLTPSAENFGGFALPSRLVFSNYADAWARGNFSVYMLSSVIVALSVVALTVLLFSSFFFFFFLAELLDYLWFERWFAFLIVFLAMVAVTAYANVIRAKELHKVQLQYNDLL